MNKRHYEHTLPNIRGSLSNTYDVSLFIMKKGTAQKLKSLSLCFSFLGTPFRHVAFIL